jgi:hypothetical protein
MTSTSFVAYKESGLLCTAHRLCVVGWTACVRLEASKTCQAMCVCGDFQPGGVGSASTDSDTSTFSKHTRYNMRFNNGMYIVSCGTGAGSV